MNRRTLTHSLLLTLLLGATAVSVASACARTDWAYSTAELPACVTLTRSGTHGFEVDNACADALVLSTTSDCPLCVLPEPIAAGEVDLLDLGGPPAVENDTVDVDWETGATSGTVSFSFPINRCPDQEGCVAAPGASSGLGWWIVAALGAVVLHRRRVPR